MKIIPVLSVFEDLAQREHTKVAKAFSVVCIYCSP